MFKIILKFDNILCLYLFDVLDVIWKLLDKNKAVKKTPNWKAPFIGPPVKPHI